MWVCTVINMLHCMTWRSTEYTYHNDAVITLTTVCFSAPSCLNNNGIVSVLLFHIIWQWLPVACSLFFLTLVIVVLFFHLRLRVCALLVLFFGNAPGNIGSAPVFLPSGFLHAFGIIVQYELPSQYGAWMRSQFISRPRYVGPSTSTIMVFFIFFVCVSSHLLFPSLFVIIFR